MINLLICLIIIFILIYFLISYLNKEQFISNNPKNGFSCNPYGTLNPDKSFTTLFKTQCYNGDVESEDLDNLEQTPEKVKCPLGTEELSVNESVVSLNKAICR